MVEIRALIAQRQMCVLSLQLVDALVPVDYEALVARELREGLRPCSV